MGNRVDHQWQPLQLYHCVVKIYWGQVSSGLLDYMPLEGVGNLRWGKAGTGAASGCSLKDSGEQHYKWW